MEEQLVQATWILAIATALLVVATAIPAFHKFIDNRREKENSAARIVPDLNILRSRVKGAADSLENIADLTGEDIEFGIKDVDEQLEMLYDIIVAKASVSLRVVNELFVLRHLLTQTHRSLTKCRSLMDNTDEQSIRERDEAIRRARRLLVAGDLTIGEIESHLPKWARLINGETFWDRFARIRDEREGEAERIIADLKFSRKS